MNIIQKICKENLLPSDKDTLEFSRQSDVCEKLYNELFETLSSQQQDLLRDLANQYFFLCGQWKADGFEDGAEKGFKLAVKLFLQQSDLF